MLIDRSCCLDGVKFVQQAEAYMQGKPQRQRTLDNVKKIADVVMQIVSPLKAQELYLQG